MTPSRALTGINVGRLDVTLRRAEPSDSDRLFDWVNRPDSLAGKLRTVAPIPRSEHERWFAACLASEDCVIWIAEVDGAAVGQVRFEHRSAGFEVDIYVDAARRRRGLALRTLEIAVARFRTNRPDARIIARVRAENIASQRLFQRAGFQASVGAAAAAADHLVFVQEPTTGEDK